MIAVLQSVAAALCPLLFRAHIIPDHSDCSGSLRSSSGAETERKGNTDGAGATLQSLQMKEDGTRTRLFHPRDLEPQCRDTRGLNISPATQPRQERWHVPVPDALRGQAGFLQHGRPTETRETLGIYYTTTRPPPLGTPPTASAEASRPRRRRVVVQQGRGRLLRRRASPAFSWPRPA